MRGEFDKHDEDHDIEMSNTDPTYTGPDPEPDVEEAPNDVRALQHRAMMRTQTLQTQARQPLAQVAATQQQAHHHPYEIPHTRHPQPGQPGGGVSWGANVRQIDRTGQTLECTDSDTVVSGLTMPTWSAQRPWEAPVYDTPYDDQHRPVVDRESVSYRNGGSRGSQDGGGDDDGGTVKTHWDILGQATQSETMHSVSCSRFGRDWGRLGGDARRSKQGRRRSIV